MGARSGAGVDEDVRVPSSHATASRPCWKLLPKGPTSMTLFAIRTLRLTQNAIGTLVARGKRARARMGEMLTRQNANRRSIEAMGQCPYRQKCHGLGLFSCKEGVWRVRRGAQWGSTEKPTCGPVWRAARGSAHLTLAWRATPASHASQPRQPASHASQPCHVMPAMPASHATSCVALHSSPCIVCIHCFALLAALLCAVLLAVVARGAWLW